jgi:hypothetical protein
MVSVKKILYLLLFIWFIGIILFLLKPPRIPSFQKPSSKGNDGLNSQECLPCLNGELNEWNCECKVIFI